MYRHALEESHNLEEVIGKVVIEAQVKENKEGLDSTDGNKGTPKNIFKFKLTFLDKELENK